MSEVRAADLPEGSVVATDYHVWIKQQKSTSFLYPWGASKAQFNVQDADVDKALAAGAEVLRHGYGEDR